MNYQFYILFSLYIMLNLLINRYRFHLFSLHIVRQEYDVCSSATGKPSVYNLNCRYNNTCNYYNNYHDHFIKGYDYIKLHSLGPKPSPIRACFRKIIEERAWDGD